MSQETDSVRQYLSNPPRIVTERLLLRPLEMTDAEAIYEYSRKPEVSRFLIFETHRSIEDTYTFLRKALQWREEGTNLVFGITLRDSGKLIGACGLHHYEQDHKSMELGYVLDLPYWNQGFMTEAVTAVIANTFASTNLHRICAHHYPGNDASGRVMEKAGMRYEGMLRQRMFVKGEFRDTKLYAILRTDNA